jgi:hypothetical protein
MDKKLAVAGDGTKAGTKALQLFAQAGVSRAVVASKNIDTILIQVANRFKAMHGSSGAVMRTKLALDLFGRSGTALLPILNRGGGALKDLKKKMTDYGLTIQDVDQKRVKKLREAQADLRQMWGGNADSACPQRHSRKFLRLPA